MSLKYGLLGQLNYKSTTGYELKKAFDQSLNFFWNAHKSQIYKELSNLEKEGLLSVELIVQEDKPNQKVYSITKKGREELQAWLEKDLNSNDFCVRNTFLMKVFFLGEISMDLAIEKINQYIEIQKEQLKSFSPIEKSIDEYSKKAGSKSAVFWKLTANYGCASTKFNIEWAEKAIKILRGEIDENSISA